MIFSRFDRTDLRHLHGSTDIASTSMRVLAAAISICLMMTTGCSERSNQSAAANDGVSAAAADTGAQTVTGKSPAALGNFPSIIIFEPVGGTDQPAQAAPPAMDQEQQTFVPSILLVRTGQPVDFLNHDDVLHNVRVRNEETKESAFNVAIPTGEKFTHTFQSDGFYDVGCDIHPGMSAQIISSASPYAVLADASGEFSITNVPDGPYRAIAYSGAEKIEKEVNVAAGSTTVDLTRP